MRIPIQVLVYPVRYVNDKWEFLLLKRLESRGGFWQGVSGHLEKGEKNIDGAKRELLEETAYLPNFIFETDFTYTIKVSEEYKEDYPEGTEETPEYVFIARINQEDDPAIDSEEHDEWKWCSYEEALELLYWEDNKRALTYCNDFLKEEM